MRKLKSLCSFFSLLLVGCGMGFSMPIQKNQQRFHPLWSQAGLVASQEALATNVGRDILQAGGNAVDAAVAVGFALAVTLPRAGNLGGGGFMLIWLNQKKQAIALNYREKAPARARSNLFLNNKGEVDQKLARHSYLAVGVPGTVAGLLYALKHYGTMSLSQVITPAIQLAQKGIIVNKPLADSLQQAYGNLKKSPASLAVFYKKQHQFYQPGERLIQKDLAHSLTLIKDQGRKAFYQGDIAKKIVHVMQAHNGLITLQDLKNYHVQVLKPIIGSYRDFKVLSMPPPSSGGITLVELLNILENFPIKQYGLNSAQSIHLLVEAMNLAYKDRNQFLGDPDFVQMPIQKLISKNYAKFLAQKINLNQHTPSEVIAKQADFAAYESPQTTHYSIVDRDGNMVANTYTLNYSYGSGYMVPGTGILLNNEMDDFTAKPGVANSYGLVQGKANAIAPNKRPLSSMTPTIVLNSKDEPLLALGSPGGSRIITTVLQVLLNYIDHDLNIASSVAMPRIHSQLWPDVIFYEQGISADTLARLKAMGHTLKPARAMGSVQIVARNYDESGGNLGFADPRKPGALVVGVRG